MIVAITGASGFIGKRLTVRHLALGDTVRALTRKSPAGVPSGCDWHHGDLLGDMTALCAFVQGADVLYHCAGEVRHPSRMQAVNVQGTRNLTQAAAGKVKRWVQLSSIGVYGAFHEGVVTEETPLTPRGPYETSKAEAERVVLEASAAGSFGYSILRPSIVYGPNMPNQSLFQMIAMVNRGLFFFIGARGASANYVHVDNVVEALVQCGTRDEALGQVFDLSDWCSMEDFVGHIARNLGQRCPTLRLPEAPVRLLARLGGLLPGCPLTASRVNALTNRARYPADRIGQILGYRPPVSLEEGLRQIVEA
jgi:nucleoside-diphosphate-sugar epimerase